MNPELNPHFEAMDTMDLGYVLADIMNVLGSRGFYISVKDDDPIWCEITHEDPVNNDIEAVFEMPVKMEDV